MQHYKQKAFFMYLFWEAQVVGLPERAATAPDEWWYEHNEIQRDIQVE